MRVQTQKTYLKRVIRHYICRRFEYGSNPISQTWLQIPRIIARSGRVLGLRPANERRRYKVTPSLIGWAQTKNQLWRYNNFPVPTRCAFPHTNASYLGVPPSGMRGPLWHLKPYNGLEFLCSMVNWWWPIRIWNEIEYLRYNLHTCVYMITLLIFPPYQRIKISGKYTTKTTNYLMLTR